LGVSLWISTRLHAGMPADQPKLSPPAVRARNSSTTCAASAHESYPHGDCDLLPRPDGRESHNKCAALPFARVVNVLPPMSSNTRGARSLQRMVRSCVRHPFSALPSSGRQLTSWPLKRGRQRPATANRKMPGPAARTMSSPGSLNCGRSWPSSTLRSRGDCPPMRLDRFSTGPTPLTAMG